MRAYMLLNKRKQVKQMGTKYKEKVQKQLEEKRTEKKAKEKKAQEEQQELKLANAESKEELLKKFRENKMEVISADTVGKLISESGFKGVRVDYSV